MRRWFVSASLALLLAAPLASACPLCRDAVPEGMESEADGDPDRPSRAWNHSIYFMLAMPYALLGTIGLLIYRNYRNGSKPAEPN